MPRTLADSLAEFDGNYRWIATFIRDAARVLADHHEKGVTHDGISLRTLAVGDTDEPVYTTFRADQDDAGRLDSAYTDADERAFKIAERADVFALGAVLYTLLSGQPPTDQPLAALSDPDGPADDIAPIDRVAPEAPAELRAICAQALSSDPIHRYLHAETLARDLDRYLSGHKPSRGGVVVFVVLAALTVLLFSLWGATGGGPARIVDVAVRTGSGEQAATLRLADEAISYRDAFRVTARLSKPAYASVYYRSPTGGVVRLATTPDDERSQDIVLPAAGDLHLPETGGMGVLVVVSHGNATPPDRAVEAAVVTAADPPRVYTPIAWTGRHLSIPDTPPADHAATDTDDRRQTVESYTEKIIRSLESDADDVAVGVLFVVGL